MDWTKAELSWRRYSLPLSTALPLAHGTLTEREGVLVHLQGAGWGDAAPLPGFSTESVDDVVTALEQGVEEGACPPSLRFALEQAAAPVTPLQAPLRINALWVPHAESLSNFLKRMASWSNPVCKVKLSPDTLEAEIEALQVLKREKPGVGLRLDPNRRLTVEQTLRLAEAVPCEYIEEPLRNPADYDELWSRAAVPVGLDESLLLPDVRDALLKEVQVKALILKPSLHGSMSDWSWALGQKKDVVISSCFESGLGLWQLAKIAETEGAELPAGLDTGGWLAEDLVSPRPLAEKGLLLHQKWGLTEETMRLFG